MGCLTLGWRLHVRPMKVHARLPPVLLDGKGTAFILSCAHVQWPDISRPSQHVSTLLLKNRRDFPLVSLWRQHREWLTTLTSCRWQDASADYRLSWAVMPTVKVLACWDANFTPVPFTVAFQLTPSRSQIRAWRYRATLLLSFYVPVQRCSSSRKSSDLSCTHREDQQLPGRGGQTFRKAARSGAKDGHFLMEEPINYGWVRGTPIYNGDY